MTRGASATSSYRFVDDKTIEVSRAGGGVLDRLTLKFPSNDVLMLKESKGDEITLQRVK